MKHRAVTAKIKYEHAMIQDLRKFLESIETWPEITSLIPGRINRTKGTVGTFHVTVQYPTRTGIKCIARRSGTAQEVFIVTNAPEAVSAKLKRLFEAVVA